MQIWSKREPVEQLLQTPEFQRGVVTIGNFDGLHVGHQSLLKAGAAQGSPRIVMTFDPHPLQILHPERSLKRIFPREDLAEQLPRFGVDLLVVLPFTREFARLPAQEFLNRYVGEAFAPRHIVAGYDFAFGQDRSGTLDTLKTWAAARGIQVHVMPPLRLGPEVVSSRRIRDLVVKGDMHGVRMFLNRPFYLRGEVVAGAGRGSQIGIPTLNQKVVNETLPPNGVYVTRASLPNGESHDSVTNIGVNPTFETGPQLKVETHVLDGRVEWRGQTVDVHFFERLREERKFAGVEELKKQIASDVLKARAVLEKIPK